MQATMNQVLAQCLESMKAMEESHKAKISLIREELGKVLHKLERIEEELILCKKALAHGSPSTFDVRTTSSKLVVQMI